MRIGYDLRRIQNPGIGRYMRQLVDAVLRVAPSNEYVLITTPQMEGEIPHSANSTVVATRARYYSVAEQFALPRIAREYRLDLFHSPHFLMPVGAPCPVVVTIHDCIYIACPEDLSTAIGRYYYRFMMQTAARRAVKIITDSEHSRRDIVRFLGASYARISVVPCGVDQKFCPQPEQEVRRVREKYGITREFVFYTAIYKPRKNHARLLQEYALLRASGVHAQLVLGGPLDEGHKSLAAMARSVGIQQDLVLTGFIPDSDLPALYSAARLYACPSTYEGFGFTILEAMACGTPVVCHPATSLPEVGGDAVLYADANTPGEFAAAMKLLLCDSDAHARRVASGLHRARQFNWDDSARRTLRAYDEALNRQEVRECA